MFENAAITKVVNANATLPKSEDLKKAQKIQWMEYAAAGMWHCGNKYCISMLYNCYLVAAIFFGMYFSCVHLFTIGITTTTDLAYMTDYDDVGIGSILEAASGEDGCRLRLYLYVLEEPANKEMMIEVLLSPVSIPCQTKRPTRQIY